MDPFWRFPDPAEQAFDRLLQLRAQLRLIATSFPGQEVHVLAAPEHILQNLAGGKPFPPFIREANPDELLGWVNANCPELAPYISFVVLPCWPVWGDVEFPAQKSR